VKLTEKIYVGVALAVALTWTALIVVAWLHPGIRWD
jgi:hypothetical protein